MITEILETVLKVLAVLGSVSVAMYCYWSVYTVVGLFATKRFPKAEKLHKYAILIPAHDEEKVVGHLIDSINAQDYPSELITIFVIADNCTDHTAEVARQHGAVCYKRKDDEHRTKGYALEYLVDNIKKDYGIENFDAYFIFDADNLLKKDYISRMNEAFDSGEKIVTSYRNTKNFNSNWIAASYGIHWLRTVRCEHRPRSVFDLATRIQGTGFMFANEIIKDGWHYVSFTEDRAFAADAVVNGYRISYCDAAEFYDEQPVSLKVAFRQRIRWGKGHLQAFVESGPKLFKHIFFWKNMPLDKYSREVDEPCGTKTSGGGNVGLFDKIVSGKLFRSLKMRFMSYDMFLIVFPSNVFWLFHRWLNFFINITICILAGAVFIEYANAGLALLAAIFGGYYKKLVLGIYVLVSERKRMIKTKMWKKIFYLIMWPLFDIIGSMSVLIAMFSHVEWKKIPHESDVNIDDISADIAGHKR